MVVVSLTSILSSIKEERYSGLSAHFLDLLLQGLYASVRGSLDRETASKGLELVVYKNKGSMTEDT